jgi:hypothetical protein
MARTRKLLLLLGIVVFVLPFWASPASAATLAVSPTTVPTGGQVTVSGDVLNNGQAGCTVPGPVTLISAAFTGLGEFAGTGATTAQADAGGSFSTTVTLDASVGPGTYDISARCGGGNLGVTATLTVVTAAVTAPPSLAG